MVKVLFPAMLCCYMLHVCRYRTAFPCLPIYSLFQGRNNFILLPVVRIVKCLQGSSALTAGPLNNIRIRSRGKGPWACWSQLIWSWPRLRFPACFPQPPGTQHRVWPHASNGANLSGAALHHLHWQPFPAASERADCPKIAFRERINREEKMVYDADHSGTFGCLRCLHGNY